MGRTNSNLHISKSTKNDEFYTRLQDIEKELFNYKDHFKDKVVLLNCDDPRVSNFFHYFFMNFKFFSLKKLIATCYKNQEWTLFSEGNSEKAVYIVYDGPQPNDDEPMPKESDLVIRDLEGDGDFRSPECKVFLEMADIIVTNPPFSMFREFVSLMNEYKKKFIILGNMNAITYKEVFPLIKDNKLWLGCTYSTKMIFDVPESYDGKYIGYYDNGKKYTWLGNIRWFTNLDNSKTKEPEYLCRKYSPEKYPKYDNYDAINVDKVGDIPDDYYGVIGVPITFLDKWNPNAKQGNNDIVSTNDFEIVGFRKGDDGKDVVYKPLNGSGQPVQPYFRIFIKRR